MNGLPGASLLGESLELGGGVHRAAFDAARGLGLVALDSGVLVATGGSGAPRMVEGAAPEVDMLAVNGNAGALYSRAAGRVQVVQGLGGSLPLRAADLPAPGAVLCLAVSREGDVVAGVEGGVYLLRTTGQTELLAEAVRPTALAIDDLSLLWADSGTGEVWKADAVKPFAVRRLLIAHVGGEVAGVAMSPDGALLAAALSDTRSVAIWNVASQVREADIELMAAPTRCQRMDTAGVFALNEAGTEPLLLLDLSDRSMPRVLFVPMKEKE